jgi:hypothetical protein
MIKHGQGEVSLCLCSSVECGVGVKVCYVFGWVVVDFSKPSLSAGMLCLFEHKNLLLVTWRGDRIAGVSASEQSKQLVNMTMFHHHTFVR